MAQQKCGDRALAAYVRKTALGRCRYIIRSAEVGKRCNLGPKFSVSHFMLVLEHAGCIDCVSAHDPTEISGDPISLNQKLTTIYRVVHFGLMRLS